MNVSYNFIIIIIIFMAKIWILSPHNVKSVFNFLLYGCAHEQIVSRVLC